MIRVKGRRGRNALAEADISDSALFLVFDGVTDFGQVTGAANWCFLSETQYFSDQLNFRIFT